MDTGEGTDQAIREQRVTPTTAELLRWWFGPERAQAGAGLRFQEEQRRSILRIIAAYEAPQGGAPWTARVVHRVAPASSEGGVRVLLALLVWQLLNRSDAAAAGTDSPHFMCHFTRHFVVVAPDLIARGRLYNALCGPPQPGGNGCPRDFGAADLVRLAALLIPPNRREEVLDFVRAHVRSGAQAARKGLGDGVIAIAGDRLEALECLARLPGAMVFDDTTRPLWDDGRDDGAVRAAWCRQLGRIASAGNRLCVQVACASRPSHREDLLAEASWS